MSRPLLLSSVGRLTQMGRQKPIKITSQHSVQDTLKAAWLSVGRFFNQLKCMAPPLTRTGCWARILSKSYRDSSRVTSSDDEKCKPMRTYSRSLIEVAIL